MKIANAQLFLSAALACASLLTVGCDININVGQDGYSFDYEGLTAQRSESGPLPADVREIEIDNQFGDVVLEGTDGNWGWTWSVKTWGDDQVAADRYLQETVLEIRQGAGVAEWKLHLPDDADGLNGVESDLVVRVPRSVSVEIDNSFGKTYLKHLNGGVRVSTSFGNLYLSEITGVVRASNSFADLTATSLSGDIRIDHSYGRVDALGIRGDVVLENSFGDTVFEGDPDTFECEHSYGAARITISGLSLNRLKAENSFGDIAVTLPPGLRVDVESSSSFGSVTTDLSGASTSSGRFDESVRTADSGAAATLDLESSHGSIRVERAK